MDWDPKTSKKPNGLPFSPRPRAGRKTRPKRAKIVKGSIGYHRVTPNPRVNHHHNFFIKMSIDDIINGGIRYSCVNPLRNHNHPNWVLVFSHHPRPGRFKYGAMRYTPFPSFHTETHPGSWMYHDVFPRSRPAARSSAGSLRLTCSAVGFLGLRKRYVVTGCFKISWWWMLQISYWSMNSTICIFKGF